MFFKKKSSLVRPEIERGISRFLIIMLHDAGAMNNLALHFFGFFRWLLALN